MAKKLWNHICNNSKILLVILSYGFLYLLAFSWLENRSVRVNIVYADLDKKIPFCEYFVVPYFLWFVYIALSIIYIVFGCKDKKESWRFVFSFCTGMTVFLLVSFFYPNGHLLRPKLEGEGFFIEAVRWLYKIDTPTNILPSMHVFVTVANSIALLRQSALRRRRGLPLCIWILSISIVLSTLFLKQHSIVDVIFALVLNVVCYVLFYRWDERRAENYEKMQAMGRRRKYGVHRL